MSLFSVGKSSALYCSVFSRELGQSSAPRGSGPAAAEAVKRLSSLRSAADESELRGKMYCLLHLLIQQEVLCWLMVCFPGCRAAGGYEACASTR